MKILRIKLSYYLQVVQIILNVPFKVHTYFCLERHFVTIKM